jgi:type I restriction enzyme S subunit
MTALNEDLPSGWGQAELGQVGRWGSGGTPKAGNSTFYGGAIPWAVIGDLNDGVVSTTATSLTEEGLAGSSAKLVEPGTVLVAMYGSIGKLGIAGMEMATNQAIAFAVPNQEVLTASFLFYFLRSQRDVLGRAGKGATQQNISQTILKAWPIPLPPLEEQERIVEVLEEHLSRLDAALANIQTVRDKAAQFRRSLLHAAFTGALTGHGGSAWPVRTLDELNDPERPICYGILKPGPDTEGGVPYVKVRNIKGGRVMLDGLHRTTAEIDSKYPRSRLRQGDLLLSIRGTYGRTAVVPPELHGGNITQDSARIAPVGARSDYVLRFLDSPQAQQFFQAVARGVAVKGVNIRDLRLLPVPVPSPDEQERIVMVVDTQIPMLDAMLAAADHAEARCAALRRSLLHAAFTGKLTEERRETAHV